MPNLTKKKSFLFFCITTILILLSICLEKDVFCIKEKRLTRIKKNKTDQKNHSFAVIIPSYNSSELVGKIFKSLSSQTYKNFKVIFIDDGSNDNTFEKAKEHEHLLHNISYDIIKNKNHKGSVECLYEVAQTLDDDQIILFFEGNCWLKYDNTIETFNSYYKRYDVWMAYAQHANYRTKKTGNVRYISSNNIFSNSARRKPWQRARLKSFYAALFKRVPISNFFFRGRFIHERLDCAYMLPMFEMAKNHVAFLNEVHCDYIKKGAKNDIRPSYLKPYKCMREILRREPLDSLKTLPIKMCKDLTDIFIFSYDRPLQLYSLLDSIYKNLKNFSDVAVLYRTSSEAYDRGYAELKRNFPNVIFVKQSNQDVENNFKELTLKTLNMLKSNYLMFAVDDMIVKDKVDLLEPISEMARTGAYFFSLRLGTHVKYCYTGGYDQRIPDHVKINDNMIAWQIDSARGDWNYYPSVDMTIFQKSHIMEIFPVIHFNQPVELEQSWLKHFKKYHKREMIRKVGITYLKSKVVNIPMNIVCSGDRKCFNSYTKEDLLEKFEMGLKIDIEPLKEISNNSVHIEYYPTFIQRKTN